MSTEMEIHAAGAPPDETTAVAQPALVQAADEAPQTEPEVKRKRGRPRKTAAPANESGSEAKEVMTPQAMAMAADAQDILTIESTRTVETEADKAKNNLLDLMESLRGKRILQGVIQGVESSRNGEPRAVVFKGEFKVMIPASLCVERPKDFRGMKPNDVLKYLITKRLGAEVEYIVKGIDPESGVVVASRHEAMAIRRRQFYYGKDRKGNNLIYEGRIAEARVISVIRTGAFVELFGVEYFIRLEELGYGDGMFTDWLFDLPGQNHPIEYLEPSEEVYCQLYFVGIRNIKQILEADDKKLMTEYRLEPPVIGEVAKLLRAKGYSCPITRVRTTYRASSWIDKLLRASLSESNAYELRYYAPADLPQTFEFLSKIAWDSIDEMILQMYYHHNLSFEEIAEQLGLRHSAVYARATNALRKLRDPRFFDLLHYGLKGTIREMLRMESECGFQDGFNRGVGEKRYELHTQDGNLPGAVLEKLEEISIEELDLSIKTRFRLHNCNVNTLADIVLASDRDLLAIKGLGRSVLQELRKKQRQAVGELRADMAADTIAGMWEQEPTEDDETS